MKRIAVAVVFVALGAVLACNSDGTELLVVQSPAADAAAPEPVGDPFDVPIDGVTADQVARFRAGDELFGLPLREGDGLGPLYTHTNCGECHTEGTRGPGLVQKMFVVEADGITPSADQSKLPFGHTVHPLLAAGARTPIVAPAGDPSIKVSTRVGPPVLGRGYMEAVLESEIERAAADQAARTDGIHGRVNHVVYDSELNVDTSVHAHKKGDKVLGRFGLKARVGYLDDFTADALQGDMGITSPLRPAEFPNPDGLTDDRKPGVDVTFESVNKRADYVRLIAIPRRPKDDPAANELFSRAKCAVCHVPSMKTRADYPVPQIAGKDAPIYTDMLLHDMGDDLADGAAGVDGEAGPRDWRTAPLIGLRFNKNFLHDSRAHSIDEAIRMHSGRGSEANESVQIFSALPEADRKKLIDFVGAL